MKLTVLTDNNVLQSKNFLGEHGLSFYIEDKDTKILFDTGYSDVFLKNALKMGIDLIDLDYIVLSHGHYDHTWGLSHYLPYYTSAVKQRRQVKKPTIIAHPDTFNDKFHDELGEIGCLIPEGNLRKNFNVKTTVKPLKLTENLTFLGEIPRLNNFEKTEPIGKIKTNEGYEEDFIKEDSALVYNTNQGIVVITGCSHSGICNIVEYSKRISAEMKVIDIIGGFHLINPPKERIFMTADYLSKLNLIGIHACHCTDFKSILTLSKYVNLEAIGVGLILKF